MQLMILIFIVSLVVTNQAPRKKRFLHFPAKTNVVLTMSLLKLLPSETVINTLTEFDVLFPVQMHPYSLSSRLKRELDQNMVLRQLIDLMDGFGMNGNACLNRITCDIQNTLSQEYSTDDNIIHDILSIIFGPAPDNELQKTCLFDNYTECMLSVAQIIKQVF